MRKLLRLAWCRDEHYRLTTGRLTSTVPASTVPAIGVVAAAGLAVVGGVGLVRLGRVRRLEVRGLSMLPTLEPTDRVVVVRAGRPRVGHVVVLADPRHRERLMVKRIESIDGDLVTLRGDNPAASTDSRVFGPVATSELRGRAVYRYHPPDRRRRL